MTHRDATFIRISSFTTTMESMLPRTFTQLGQIFWGSLLICIPVCCTEQYPIKWRPCCLRVLLPRSQTGLLTCLARKCLSVIRPGHFAVSVAQEYSIQTNSIFSRCHKMEPAHHTLPSLSTVHQNKPSCFKWFVACPSAHVSLFLCASISNGMPCIGEIFFQVL